MYKALCNMSKRLTTEEFIKKSIKKHGNKYDYSKVEYANNKTKVCIICPEHGEFWQTPSSHLRGSNCPVCSKFEGAKKTAIKRCIYNSYETIKKYASKCVNRYDFFKKYRMAWLKSKQNGWLDDFFPINQRDKEAKVHYVYSYIFDLTNSIYIGRTNNTELRDKNHHKEGAVYQHSIESNISIPKMNILYDKLTLDESKIKEDEMVKLYKSQGYNVLNKAKTGLNSSSIGGFGFGKLTEEYCLNKAKECNSLAELRIKYPSVENKARKNDWLKNYTWFIHKELPKGYWKYEHCYEKAKEYQTRGEFQKGCISAYDKARKNGWLNDYYWFVSGYEINGEKQRKWNEETCYKEATKYNTRSEFQKCCGRAYQVARKNGWLDKLFPKQP